MADSAADLVVVPEEALAVDRADPDLEEAPAAVDQAEVAAAVVVDAAAEEVEAAIRTAAVLTTASSRASATVGASSLRTPVRCSSPCKIRP
jgi:hypothetical protein